MTADRGVPHDDRRWSVRFPALFTGRYIDYAACHVRMTTGPVPVDLIARLHVVAVTGPEHVIVCRSIQGWRFLPGGTREPGETLAQLAARELREEAGARLTGEVAVFAAHVADSEREAPYRPHLPHPRAYWAFAVARADVVGPPSNPDDGEHVVEVLTLPPADAADYIEEHDPVHADVVRLAQEMRLI